MEDKHELQRSSDIFFLPQVKFYKSFANEITEIQENIPTHFFTKYLNLKKS